jgi:large subunit ribosomal protein L15
MTYGLNNLKPAAGSRRGRRRIGRGNASGMGTYATRGMKGQRARTGGRSGLKLKGMKRIIARLPKYHGMRSLSVKPEMVTLEAVSRAFGAGGEITLVTLKKKGLVSRAARSAKLVGKGKIKNQYIIKGVSASAAAKEAINAAGGSFAPEQKS